MKTVRKIFFFISIFPALAFLPACGLKMPGPKGLIYTHVTIPLDINQNNTDIIADNKIGDIKHLSYYVDILWDGNAIGSVARQNNLETLYFADLEVLSVLGVWHQYTVHVYGDKKHYPSP